MERVDDTVLIKLQLDCVEWRIAVEEQRDAIRTPPAMTEWNVLVKMEVEMVIAAHDRIADERRYRRMLADRPRTSEGS